MDAVALAAGEGTGLRPLPEDRPGGMAEVAGEPVLIEQLVDLLRQSGRAAGTVGLESWYTDVAYPGDRDETERRFGGDARETTATEDERGDTSIET